MKNRLATAVFVALSMLPALRAPASTAPPADTTYIYHAAQDSCGDVWGVVDVDRKGVLARWSGHRWSDTDIDFAKGYSGICFAPGPKGSLYCLWYDEVNPGYLISAIDRNTANGSSAEWRLVAKFGGSQLGYPDVQIPTVMFVDSSANVWITGQAPTIRRVSASGNVTDFPLPERCCFPNRVPARNDENYEPIRAIEDGRGRVWFWCDDTPQYTPSGCVRGVLIADGDKLDYHPTISGLPDQPLTAMAVKDNRHLWVGTDTHGVYVVDIDTLTAKHLADPPSKSTKSPLVSVARIFKQNGDWYFVSDGPSMSLRQEILWRLDRQGRWKQVIDGLDSESQSDTREPERPWLATNTDLWVGCYGGGVWRIPVKTGKPQQLDWRVGLPVDVSRYLFRLSNGRILAVGPSTAEIDPSKGSYRGIHPTGWREFVTSYNVPGLLQDADHNLWAVLTSYGQYLLGRWDGRMWTKYAIPPTVPVESMDALGIDTQGRVWLMPSDANGPVAVFDPRKRSWRRYASLKPACEAYAKERNMALNVSPEMSACQVPQFDRGRVCYIAGGSIFFYNHGVWNDYIGGMFDQSPPFFTPGDAVILRGGLPVALRPKEVVPLRLTDVTLPAPIASRVVPAQLPVGDGSGYACWVGSQEAWIVHGRVAHEWTFGRSRERFTRDGDNPFIDGRRLMAVWRDKCGNIVLCTEAGAGRDNLIRYTAPRHIDLAVKLQTVHLNRSGAAQLPSAGEATITVDGAPSATTDKGIVFTWRVDDGAWSSPISARSFRLPFLLSGRHRLEALAIDSDLDYIPTPARADFTVRTNDAQELTIIVKTLLKGSDASKQAAIDDLILLGPKAVAELKRVRPTLDEGQQWWIDAALQAIADAKDRRPAAPSMRPAANHR